VPSNVSDRKVASLEYNTMQPGKMAMVIMIQVCLDTDGTVHQHLPLNRTQGSNQQLLLFFGANKLNIKTVAAQAPITVSNHLIPFLLSQHSRTCAPCTPGS